MSGIRKIDFNSIGNSSSTKPRKVNPKPAIPSSAPTAEIKSLLRPEHGSASRNVVYFGRSTKPANTRPCSSNTLKTSTLVVKPPHSSSQASTNSHVTTPSVSPRQQILSTGKPFKALPHTPKSLTAMQLARRVSNSASSTQAGRFSSSLVGCSSTAKKVAPGKAVLHSFATPPISSPLNSLAAQIMSASKANDATKKSTFTSAGSKQSSPTNAAVSKSTTSPKSMESVPPPVFIKPKTKATEVIPTSDDEELELTSESKLALGSLDIQVSRRCSRNGCRNEIPLSSKFLRCETCRAYSREKSREYKARMLSLRYQPGGSTGVTDSALPPNHSQIPSTMGPSHNAQISNVTSPTLSRVSAPPINGTILDRSPTNNTFSDDSIPYHPPAQFPITTPTNATLIAVPESVGPSETMSEADDAQSRLKQWMQRLRLSGRLKQDDVESDVGQAVLGKRKNDGSLASSGMKKRKTSHYISEDDSQGQRYQDLNALCNALRSHTMELKQAGYQNTPNFFGFYTVIAGPTRDFFEDSAKVTIQEMVQKTGLCIRLDIHPFTMDDQHSHHATYKCSCSDLSYSPPSAPPRCGGYIRLKIQKVSCDMGSRLLTADQVILHVEHPRV